MSWLLIEDFAVQVAEGTEWEDEQFGDIAPSFNNTMRSDIRSHHLGKRVQTVELDADDALVLRMILRSPGSLRCSGDWVEEIFGTDEVFMHRIGPVRVRPLGDATSSILQFSLRQSQGAVASPLLFSFDGDAPGAYTFTRTGAGPYIDESHEEQSAAENVFRREHLDLDMDDVVDTVAGLFGPARTNLVSSDDFDGGWASVNAPGVTTGIDDPFGGTGAFRIADADPALSAVKRLAVTFTGDATKVVTFTVREATKGANDQVLSLFDDSATAARLLLQITSWTDGAPNVTAATGTYLGKLYRGNGYWTLFGISTTVTAANTNRLYVSPGGVGTGSIDIYRANAFDVTSMPPYSILDASQVLGAETWFADFGHAPRAMTIYMKFLEAGARSVANATLLHIGAADGTSDPRILIHRHGTSSAYAVTHDDGTTPDDAILTTLPEFDSVVELCASIDADGGLRISQSIDSGAEESAEDLSAPALGTAWSATRVYLGIRGSGNYSPNPIISVRIVEDVRDMAEMRQWAKARLHPRLAA